MKKVLIIEDSELTRTMVRETLTAEGYMILEASNGLGGLKLAFEEKPQLIILDIIMPQMDGIKTCRMLAAGSETRDIPVIMLTSKTSSSDVKEGLEVGAVDYIKKPFDKVELLARIESAIRIKEFKDQIASLRTKLKELITTDDLTGLKNASFFWDYINREVNKLLRIDNPLSLVIMDIDDFKWVNDTFGHLTGDMVIKEVAQILQSNIRRYDLLARYGGEEFVVVLIDTEEDEAISVAENLRRKVQERKFNEGGKKFQLSVSCGVASLTKHMPKEMFKAISLFERADKALYEAKEKGKGMSIAARQNVE